MYDRPTPAEITQACERFFRQAEGRVLSPAEAYEARVAANALALVARQDATAGEEAAELHRLRVLLGRDGDLAALNDALAQAIAARSLRIDEPAVKAHLWATTLAKVAVDQPSYAAYRAETGT